uniref:Uncharacterized protein n=1 Tax=Rhizophora mucronata TaxID=61149 RepID=A0A2P2N833_RHIMU
MRRQRDSGMREVRARPNKFIPRISLSIYFCDHGNQICIALRPRERKG